MLKYSRRQLDLLASALLFTKLTRIIQMVLVKFFSIFEWLSFFFGNQNQAANERYERNSLGCLLKINDLGGTTLEKIDRLA